MSGMLISYMCGVYYAFMCYAIGKCIWQKSTRFRGCLGYRKGLMYEFTHSFFD